jgi:hypothetical protein
MDIPNPSNPIELQKLDAGVYYWTIQAKSSLGQDMTPAKAASFTVQPLKITPISLSEPLNAEISGLDAWRKPLVFQWSSEEKTEDVHFLLAKNANMKDIVLDISDPKPRFELEKTTPGEYFWTVKAKTPDGYDITPKAPARFKVLPVNLPLVTLIEPKSNAQIAGLAAFREGISFNWNLLESAGETEFVLSRVSVSGGGASAETGGNARPSASVVSEQPVETIKNPPNTVLLNKLAPGDYSWTVKAKTADGIDLSPKSSIRFKIEEPVLPPVSLDYPAAGAEFDGITALLEPDILTWSTDEAITEARVMLAANIDALKGAAPNSGLIVDFNGTDKTVRLPPLDEGQYYWSVRAKTTDGFQLHSTPASFIVLPRPRITLETTPDIAGLDAIHNPPELRWSSQEMPFDTRFILSKSADINVNTAIMKVDNPGASIQMGVLDAGNYYWTVQGHNSDGLDISPRLAAHFKVLPIPALPDPVRLTPAEGATVGESVLKANNLVFSWETVAGANAYIITILAEDKTTVISQVTISGADAFPEDSNVISWKPKSLGIFQNGTFYWSVEAIRLNANGIPEQRGTTRINRFVLSFIKPKEVEVVVPSEMVGTE